MSTNVKRRPGSGKIKMVDGKALDMRATAVAERDRLAQEAHLRITSARLTPDVVEYSVSMERARARFGNKCIDVRWIESRQAFYVVGNGLFTIEMAAGNAMYLIPKED